MKKKKNPIIPLLWLTVIALGITGMVRHFHIKNFNVIQKGVLYTSGQPRGMDYTRLLYKYHIATFINLRVGSEHREENWYQEEAEWMKSSGVQYITLPISKRTPIDKVAESPEFQKFMEIMSDTTNRPVHIYDSSGRDRVSYFAALWMLKAGGFSLEETVKKIGKLQKAPLDEKELAFLKSIVSSR
jgi:protein tyrosine/serine phosphatase